jgi:hypothetical protein
MGSTVLIGSVVGVEGDMGGSVVMGLTEVGLFGVDVNGMPVVVGGIADVLGGMVVVVGTWHTSSFGKAPTAVTTSTSSNGILYISHVFVCCASLVL